MFHFPRYRFSVPILFGTGYPDITLDGLPHWEIPGSKLVCSSSGRIAAYHVLHRLN